MQMQDPCLSLAFDYAEHDLYAMIAYHRERLRSAPIPPFTVKSVMWQLLNGLSYLEQVLLDISPAYKISSARVSAFDVQSVMWQPRNGLSYLEQVLLNMFNMFTREESVMAEMPQRCLFCTQSSAESVELTCGWCPWRR